MAQPTIQCSFNSGEWAPNLFARTDLEKYHSGAALLRNWFVDYRGGATTRDGTKYLIRGFKDSTAIRLIPFQANFTVRFAMEFGDGYIRFFQNGAPILEAATSITIAVVGPPEVFTDIAHGYVNGDWIFAGGNYYIIQNKTTNTYTLTDLFGLAITTNPFTLPAAAQRVFTLVSPYAAADLAYNPITANPGLKFVQNVNTLIITHPNYVPYALTYSSSTPWSLAPIVFGSQAATPTNVTIGTTLAAGSVYYAYVVTSVDGAGEESIISTPGVLNGVTDLRTVAGTNTISWTPQVGAVSYNVYKATVSYSGPIPVGAAYGYIGNTTATSFADSNIVQDFSQPPPTYANPFATGSQVTSVIVGTAGTYTTAPTVAFSAPPSGITALGSATLGVTVAVEQTAGTNYNVGDTITLSNGVVLTVATLSGSGVATVTITNGGLATIAPTNPVAQVISSGAGTGFKATLTWGVNGVVINTNGAGYITAPTIIFGSGTAAATAVIGPASVGNPSVPVFFQQRLALAAPVSNPQTIYFSQPGNYYNNNVSIPAQADDAITAPIVSGQLNNIKAMIPQPGGLIVLTDGGSDLINGGSLGSTITPASITANAQAFLGCNDMPPIVVNYDILYVQSKGSSVRDASYNFYANVFTGTDISVYASHLFFGYQLLQWAWAEEPYKVVWAVRNDGVLLSLTFVKEQEFIGWAHHDTLGLWQSICTIVEATAVGYQNYLYHVIQRTVNGVVCQYIEYTPARSTATTPNTYWTVDAGLQYSGAPTTNFSGAQHLSGLTCTGLADGVPITPFVMPYSGAFILGTAASLVTVGLAYLPQIQNLPIDLGQPTVQSKEKKLPQVTMRVVNTLGLQAGTDQVDCVAVKDLVLGNVGSMTNQVVSGLVTGDVRCILDPKWQTQGQIFIQQTLPYPASILGLIIQVAMGDTPK